MYIHECRALIESLFRIARARARIGMQVRITEMTINYYFHHRVLFNTLRVVDASKKMIKMDTSLYSRGIGLLKINRFKVSLSFSAG